MFFTVQRYHLLNFSSFLFDTGGLVYPKAINQLFLGLYIMEIYLVGLFLLVRDKQGRVACAGQGSIMILVTMATAIYHFLLNKAFNPLFKYLPMILNDLKPHGKGDKASLSTPKSWYNIFRSFFKGLDDIVYREEIHNEPDAKRPMIDTDLVNNESGLEILEDEALTAEQKVIWVPRDNLGISQDERVQSQAISKTIVMSDENAEITETGSVICYGPPPISI